MNTYLLQTSDKMNTMQTVVISTTRNHSVQGFGSSFPDKTKGKKSGLKSVTDKGSDETRGGIGELGFESQVLVDAAHVAKPS